MKHLLTIALLTLTGCVTINPQLPDLTAEECWLLGVDSTRSEPSLPVVRDINTTLGRVQKACDPDWYGVGFLAGCIKPVEGGYEIWRAAPIEHEACHALYGPDHSNSWMPFEEGE